MADNPAQEAQQQPEASAQAATTQYPDWATDPARAVDIVKELRDENKARRLEMDNLKQQLAQLQAADNQPEKKTVDEQPKTQAPDLDALRQELTEQLTAQFNSELEKRDRALAQASLREKAVSEASKLNFADPSDVTAFLDMTSLTAETLADKVKELADSKPHLLKRGLPNVNPTNPAGASPTDVGEQYRRLRSGFSDPFRRD